VGSIAEKIVKQLKLKNIEIPKNLYNLNINSSDIPNSNFKGPF
jgi:hypothetical protein